MTTILYVEDNEDNIYMLVKRLERNGYTILIARDGKQGIETAKATLPDIILMDLGLPIIDGWKAIQLLRVDANTRRIPIIAVSAHSMDHDRSSAIKAGADDFVSKPIKMSVLLKMLKRLLTNT
ncbi:response regulator [Pseudomonadota bacterium]